MSSSLVLNRRPKVPAEDTAAFGAIAERFRRGGALEQAVSLCRDGLKKFPDHVSARVTLGWALLDLGKYEEARIELEQVMRRAPDNLAAIRGLAELHDRFEHTLNLPMDGPGEWPPPASSVEDTPAVADDGLMTFQGTSSSTVADASSSDDSIIATAATMVPAEMGLPLWTPGPAAAASEAVGNAQINVHVPSGGMSSVREIDAFAGAPVPMPSERAEPAQPAEVEASVIEEPVAFVAAEAGEAAEISVQPAAVEELGVTQELGVTDETLAALIAEADTLDAVADLDAVVVAEVAEVAELEAPALELAAAEAVEFADADEFSATDTVELVAADTVELAAAELGAAEFAGVVEEAETVELDAEVSSVEIEPVVLESAMAAMMDAAEPELEVSQPEAVVVAEAEVEEAAVSGVEPEVIAVAALQADVPVEAVAEAVADAVEAEAHAEPEAELAVAAIVETQAPLAEVLAFVRPEVEESVAEAGIVAISPAARKRAATVIALEQMLQRVHARRHQLMAESVA